MTSEYTFSSFQMLPLDDFCQAILDLVKKYKWQDVSIFFDDQKGTRKSIAFGLSFDHTNKAITCIIGVYKSNIYL